jgi:DNA excision repair protein ERCC-4
VIELHVEMTDAMRTIQTSVLDLINFSLSELKRLNPNLLVDDLTVENAISRFLLKHNFHQ